MLHGRAVIDLHNCKTHKDEKIVHDNMLTHWITDIMDCPNIYLGRDTTNLSLSRDKIFGGLMMFDTPLETSSYDYWFPNPSDAKMVAHAGSNAYTGPDLTRGSYNPSASSGDSSSITKVWDFAQERGNGTIGSLGLCYDIFGVIGSGVADKFTVNSTNMINMYESGMASVNGGLSNCPNGIKFCSYENSLLCIATISNAVLTITYSYLPSAVGSLNLITDNLVKGTSSYVESYADANANKTPITETIDLSSYLDGSGNGYLYFLDIDGNLGLMRTNSTSWNNGDSKKIVWVNLVTGRVVDSITIQNNTGTTLQTASSGPYSLFGCSAAENYLYFKENGTRKLFYINMSDDTDCGEITYANGDSCDFINTGASDIFYQYGNWICVTYINFPSNDSYKYSYPQIIISGKKLWRLCCTSLGRSGSSFNMSGGFYKAWESFWNTTDNIYLQRIPSLTTINDLDDSVTKTSDMTMRVSYTIADGTLPPP